jgi:hypothetical protein
MNLKIRKILGRMSQLINTGWGSCKRCGITWAFVHGHITDYDLGDGCFPLCESCWKDLTPEERLPFYRQMYDEWGTLSPDWEKIEAAVLDGK